MARLVEYNEKVAISFGWLKNRDKPQYERDLIVGQADAENWKSIIGNEIQFTGNLGYVQDYERSKTLYIDTENGEWDTRVKDTRPIPKPRRSVKEGQACDWEYRHGEWCRVWMDCETCETDGYDGIPAKRWVNGHALCAGCAEEISK